MASTLALRDARTHDAEHRSREDVQIRPNHPRRRLWSVVLGPPDQPRWARPLLWALLLATAALYLVDLSSSGTANEFYAAAVKSGTESWKAWLFGSLDSANAITVDKPPVSLWLMVLSARIFGFSSFSMLLPEALLGVGTVGLTYAAVRRWSGPAAGLIAGTLLALTPVAALMFRFNNPDALLVFLLTLGAYCVIRAIDSARTAEHGGRSRALRWMVGAGAALGFAFLTKMGQGLLVVPAFGLVYLVAAPSRLRTRLLHLVGAFLALVVSAGWFIALVELWPAASRPYIGGSTDNSLWELALGYNGLGRLLGGSGNGGGGGGGGASFGGTAGLTRLVNTAFGTQIFWFLPAALVALVAVLVLTRRRPRTDRTRAAAVLWGGWLLTTAVVFSFMSGTIHPYYAVALAPAIAALVAIGGTELWSRRHHVAARGTLALILAGTAGWGCYLMLRDAGGWHTWLAWTMLAGGVLGAVLLVLSTGRLNKLAVAAVLLGAISAGLGAASFTAATVSTGHTGSTPTAGPSVVSTSGMGGGTRGAGTGGPGGQGGQPPTQQQGSTGTSTGTAPTTTEGTGTADSSTQTPTQGGGGGGNSTDTELVAALNATSTTWSAAVVGDQAAAGYILATDTAVMAIGGWSGSDDAPTLAQFQAYVTSGQIGYFIVSQSGGGGGAGGTSDSSASQITSWVEANYTATTVGSTTVYVLNG